MGRTAHVEWSRGADSSGLQRVADAEHIGSDCRTSQPPTRRSRNGLKRPKLNNDERPHVKRLMDIDFFFF